MKLKPAILASFLVISVVLNGHPLKMTTSKLSYNQERKHLELTINFFFDDFSSEMAKIYHLDKISIHDDEFKDIVLHYINNNFKILIDSVTGTFALKNIDMIDENVLQVLIQVNNYNTNDFNIIQIFNKVLIESFKEQINILHVKLEDEKRDKIYRFDRNQTIAKFKVGVKK